jgi:hypothetical protein
MTRRFFGLTAGSAFGAPAALRGPEFSAIPIFCSHEHWGSIDSIGPVPGGFRADAEPGALPRGRTGLIDMVFEPYLDMSLRAAGYVPDIAGTSITSRTLPGLNNSFIARSDVTRSPLL